MPFNGSGTFTRLRNWVNDATAGIKIRADYHDSEDDNLAQGLSQCITKDGQTTVTANLPMSSYKHTNVAAASNLTDYARFDQVRLAKSNWADAGGTADAITATYSPSTGAPVDGQEYLVRAGAANTTSTPTFSPDGNTARTIVKYGNAALVAGDIAGDGHELVLKYRSSDTKYELLNPAVTLTTLGAQPLDAELTAIAGLISAANKIIMFSGSGTATMIDFKDEDNMVSDSATAVPSQQSVKAYVDARPTKLVNVAFATTSTRTTTAVEIPQDNTVPQNTEGAELITLAYTPTNSANTLEIEFTTSFTDVASGTKGTFALFQDSDANALRAGQINSNGGGSGQSFVMKYVVAAGSTSARTYKIRFGGAGGNVMAVNGTSAAAQLGGTAASILKITEYAA